MFPIIDVSDDSSDEIITLDIEEGAAIVDDNESHDIEEGNGNAAGEEAAIVDANETPAIEEGNGGAANENAEETNEGSANGGGEHEAVNIQDWSSAANE